MNNETKATLITEADQLESHADTLEMLHASAARGSNDAHALHAAAFHLRRKAREIRKEVA